MKNNVSIPNISQIQGGYLNLKPPKAFLTYQVKQALSY